MPDQLTHSSEQNGSHLRFGPFVLDLHLKELYRENTPVNLAPKLFQVLVFLVRNRERTVSHEDLLAGVWADVHVEPNVIEQAISGLRRALGDDAQNPRFIKTLKRRGYRFIAETETGVRQTCVVPFPQRGNRFGTVIEWIRGRRIVAASGAVLLLVVLTNIARPALPAPEIKGMRRITESSMAKFTPIAVAREQIYFTGVEDGHYRIFRVASEGGESRRVSASVENLFLCDVAPDGSKLLARRVPAGPDLTNARLMDAPLYEISLPAGSPRQIVESGYDATWSPDKEHVTYSRGHELYVVPAAGGRARQFLSVAGEPFWPR